MDYLNFNIFNSVIFSGIVQGLIFSLVVFFHKKYKSQTNNFVALTVLVLSLSNFQYWLLDVGFRTTFENYFLYIPMEFLMGPFFYMFVKYFLKKEVSLGEKTALFSLFFIAFTVQLVGSRLDLSEKELIFLNLMSNYLPIIFTLGLIILIFRLITNNEKESMLTVNSIVRVQTQWLKRYLLMGLVLCVLWFLSTNYLTNLGSGYDRYYPLWIGVSVLIYWMAYESLLQSRIYSDRVNIRKSLVRASYRTGNLGDVISNSFEKINNLIIDEKLYLNPTFNLEQLSIESDFSMGYLSQLFSSNSKLNFKDYVNSLRIQESKRILQDNSYNDYTIIAIGLEAGFNSKSSFYTAFKKFTGKTPVDYKKHVRNS